MCVSSPVSNYITVTYPPSILSLLRIRSITAPFKREIFQEIWLKVCATQAVNFIYRSNSFKTFFDLDFEPDIMIGPIALEYLRDYIDRYNTSVDTVITFLQVNLEFKLASMNPNVMTIFSWRTLSISAPIRLLCL